MIDRFAFGQMDPDCRQPRLLRQGLDLLHGPGYVAAWDLGGALQAPWRAGRIVMHIPVIGPIEAFRQGDVERRQTRRPGAREHEVDVAPLEVHIGEPARGIFLVHTRLDSLAVMAADSAPQGPPPTPARPGWALPPRLA